MEAATHCRNHWDTIEGLRRCSRCGETFCADCVVTLRGLPFCASCKSEQILDVRSGVDAVEMDLGSRAGRLFASIIDGFITGIPSRLVSAGIIALLTTAGRRSGFWELSGIGATIGIMAAVPYEALLLTRNGQTVGKRALRLRVVSPDGSQVTAKQAWVRAISRTVLGLFVIVDWPSIFFTAQKLCLHDMIAGTRVVKTQR